MGRTLFLLGYIALLSCSQTVAQTPARKAQLFEFRAARTTPAAGYPLAKSANGTRFYIAETVLISEDDIVSASVDTSALNSGVVLEVRLDSSAAVRLQKFTQHHVREYLALFLNGELSGTPPRIMDPISGPALTLTGLPSADAHRLAAAVAARRHSGP